MSFLDLPVFEWLYREGKYHDLDDEGFQFWYTFINWKFPVPEGYATCREDIRNDRNEYVTSHFVVLHTSSDRPSQHKTKTVMFFKAKLVQVEETLEEVENQVHKAAKVYLESDTTSDQVVCMTTCGVKYRCWVVHRGNTDLGPVLGSTESSRDEAYIDIGSDNAERFSGWVDTIKAIR